MNLSPYPNLRTAEKVKSQSTLRILQKDFYSVYLTHQLCIQQIVEGCKSSLFLIVSIFHLLLYLMVFAFNSQRLHLLQNDDFSKCIISGAD